MRNFFPCHRKWLFSNVINLKEDSLDTDLMGPFDMGTINHKILELFMQDYLKSQDLTEIQALGEDFNTDFHEAVTQFPVEDEAKKGKVIDVIQKGYKINDKVVRYSKVVVGQ